MAEPRRVQLTTLSDSGTLSATLFKKANKDTEACTPGDTEKSETTARLVITLFEPDDRRCPEFYYPELVGRNKKESVNVTADFFENAEDNDKQRQEVEALAKKFEEKYGPKKRKKDRMQDLIDMGYGYDDTDPFIDNSEAYDELVPASLTTKYGGFYINSGTLQFRQASESEQEDDFTKEKKKVKSPKKKKIKDGNDKIKKKKKEDSQHKKSKLSKAGIIPLNSNKEEKKKKKKYTGALSVKEMLKKFQKEKEAMEKEDPKSLASIQTTRDVEISLNVSDPLFSLIGSANENDLLQAASSIDIADIDLEKLLSESPAASPLNDMDEGSDPLSAGQSTSHKQMPTLPEGLPMPLETRIKELTLAAKASEGEGKQKFFTQDVNNMLLDIELQSRELNNQARSGVYAHLASFLPCSKDTLVKRAKKLHLHEQDGRLKDPMQKLKEAIGRAMPDQISRYQDECQAHTQAKFAKMLEEGKEKEQKDRLCSDEDEDEEKSGKRVMGPRKKFLWNEEIREFLCNVVRIKMGSYELEKNKSQSAEEYLKAFLEAEVKMLWPKGWMQARMLFKESRRAHSHFTSAQTKKKVITAPKMKIKDPFVKLERKIIPLMNTSVTQSGSTLMQGACASPLTSVGSFISATTVVPNTSSTTNPHSFNMDDSLDEDLIHNPPSLEAVSEELAALNSAARGSPDFNFPLVPKSMSEVKPILKPTEETKNLTNSILATSAIIASTPSSSQSPLNLLAEQALALGQLSQDRQPENHSAPLLVGFKGLLNQPSSKNLSENHQAKHKNLGLQRTSQAISPVQSQSLRPFHQTDVAQKNFPSPQQFNINKLQNSQTKASKLLQQCATLQQAKNAKTQTFHGSAASLPNNVQAAVSAPKILTSQSSSVLYTSKHSSVGSSNQSYKTTFSLSSLSKPTIPSSSLIHSASSNQTSLSSGLLTSRKPPSPSQSASLQSQTSTVQKSSVSQKLTLVAPPGGINGESTAGTQGVARLLTSSLKPVAVSSCSTSSQAASSLKNTTGTSVLSSSPSLSLLSPSFTTTGQKLAPGTLGILPGIVPMHTFSFPVISFGSDSSAATGTKDAIVTGPAPGTFHHGLTHNGNQIHGDSTNAQRKLQ
ncbi:ubinuclein-1-like isoform X2 [Polypterus senegalus]|uniref:ubinuclein-1-like isoform X2 n=1 Tax=Polypterus senegalus TaxID=55291 RepID=UPI0019627445|nr:ubinuclein-1-like isoform X2 [Polypterus senegalus]